MKEKKSEFRTWHPSGWRYKAVLNGRMMAGDAGRTSQSAQCPAKRPTGGNHRDSVMGSESSARQPSSCCSCFPEQSANGGMASSAAKLIASVLFGGLFLKRWQISGKNPKFQPCSSLLRIPCLVLTLYLLKAQGGKKNGL